MNAKKILNKSQSRHERVSEYLRDFAKFFHNNEGDLKKRNECVQELSNKFNLKIEDASLVVSQLVEDTVDPVVQIEFEGQKYVGVVEFKEFDGAYGYIDYNDIYGSRKRVVCQECVNTSSVDSNVTHATEKDPHGSFPEESTWDELVSSIHHHYEEEHSIVPEEIKTGATLASGTTIGGNISFHAGNDGIGSGIDSDTIRGKTPKEVVSGVKSSLEEFEEESKSSIGNISSSLSNIRTNIASIQFQTGLDELEFSSGIFDLFENSNKITQSSNVQINNSEINLIDESSNGVVLYEKNAFSFVPEKAVLTYEGNVAEEDIMIRIIDENDDVFEVNSIDNLTEIEDIKTKIVDVELITANSGIDSFSVFFDGNENKPYFDSAINSISEV